MNYEYTPEHNQAVEQFKQFCLERIEPNACALDEQGAASNELLLGNLKALAEQTGYFGTRISKRFGGGGASSTETISFMETLAAHCSTTYLSATTTMLFCGLPILLFGSEERKQGYLPRLAAGKLIGALAETEREGGWDSKTRSATAQRDGDDYLLSGRKAFVTNGPIADLIIVIAANDEGPSPWAFMVEGDLPGFSRGQYLPLMGHRGLPVCDLHFDQCRLPASARLAPGVDGREIAEAIHLIARIGMAVGSIGLSQACLDESITYAMKRKKEGKPIIAFEEVSFKLAEAKTMIETARLLTNQAAWLADVQRPKEADLAASAAKLFATESATKIASDAVQIHGGHGYLQGAKVERLYRDAKLGELASGPNELQRIKIAKDTLEKYG